jgi:hypothetical protein
VNGLVNQSGGGRENVLAARGEGTRPCMHMMAVPTDRISRDGRDHDAPAPAPGAPTSAQAAFDRKMQVMDQSRENVLPKIGATSYTINREAIETLPQGDNTPIDKVILQAPGVSYDSAVANPDFHVRNEYANVQYRINGVLVPEGVSGLGPVLATNFIGTMSLLTGTLPASRQRPCRPRPRSRHCRPPLRTARPSD